MIVWEYGRRANEQMLGVFRSTRKMLIFLPGFRLLDRYEYIQQPANIGVSLATYKTAATCVTEEGFELWRENGNACQVSAASKIHQFCSVLE